MLELSPLAVCAVVVIGVVLVVLRVLDGGDDVAATEPDVAVATTVPATSSTTATTTTTPIPASSTTAVPTSAPSTTVPPPTAPPRPAPTRPVTLAFGGDVHFEGSLDGRLRQDPTGLLAPVAPVLAAADVAVVNLETNVTERGDPEPKAFTFRAPEEAFIALASAGVDMVSVANNHGRDFGEVALLDTLDAAARHGMPVIGGGRNEAEAYDAHRVEVAGRRIAVLGATQVLDSYALDAWVATAERPGLASAKQTYLPRLLAQVAAEAQEADTVVVFLHWGRELETCPTGDQQALARALVDAGADVVVGGHAHRVQGGGRLDGAVVHYGLGNFVFYSGGGPGTRSGVFEVTVDVDDSLTYRWVPARLRGGVATPLDGGDAARELADWDGLRGCTGLAP
jgi:hypothetical protein